MSAYLTAQPPALFIDNAPKMLSAIEFCAHLCRALRVVGMSPIASTWDQPMLEPAAILTMDFRGASHIYPFDYPIADTFTVDGETWQPYVAVVMGCNDPRTTPYDYGYTYQGGYVGIQYGIRRPGPFSLDRKITLNQGLNGAYNGIASDGITSSSGQFAPPWRYLGGCVFRNERWRPSKSFGVINPTAGGPEWFTLDLRHTLVYLGPGGLFVYAGSGTQRAQQGAYISTGGIAAGGRIPNRATTGVDTNLPRINPIVPLPMREEDDRVWDGVLHGFVQGMQYNLKKTTGIVQCHLFNLENLEWPIWPTYRPYTTPSPRVISGLPVHVLARLVQVPTIFLDTPTLDFGPRVLDLSEDETRPKWSEVFSSYGFRFCDRTAPIGDYEDPITGLNWYLLPAYNSGGMMGVLSEGATYTDILPTPVKTPFGTPWNISINTALNAAQPVPTEIIRNADGTTPRPVTQAARNWWVGATATNTITSTLELAAAPAASYYNYPHSEIQFYFDPVSTDPVDVLYSVQYDTRARGTNNVQTDRSRLTVQALLGGAWTTIAIHLNPGNVVSRPEWDYQTFEFFLGRAVTDTGGRLVLRFFHDYPYESGIDASMPGATHEVRNIVLKRQRYT